MSSFINGEFKEIEMAGHVLRMVEEKNAFRTLVGIS
jgi:hypothetical protein